jgi:biopolymer transport protein ExbB
MRRTLIAGPWHLWIVLVAVVLALGMAAVPPVALAQGDDDPGVGDDDGIDVGGDEGIDIGDDVDLGDDDDTGGEATGDDETISDDDTADTSEEGEGLSTIAEAEKEKAKERDVRAPGLNEMSLWDMMVIGGPCMFVLLAIQIVSVALILESAFTVNVMRVVPVDFVEAIEEDFEKNDVDAVVTKCEENPGMLANVLHAGLTAPSPAESDVKEAIELAGEHEGETFLTHVGYLSIFAVIAPMVGLLGTVTGMVLAFNAVATQSALGRPELLATGIFQALFTTVFGLVIGIPTMFMYYYYKSRGIKILMLVENSVKRFMKWRSQPDNSGVPRGGLVPQRLALLIDEALSNAFVGIMPFVGLILGPFAIAKGVKLRAEAREVGGNPTSALAAEPWRATMAMVLGIVDIVVWPLLLVLAVVLGWM